MNTKTLTSRAIAEKIISDLSHYLPENGQEFRIRNIESLLDEIVLTERHEEDHQTILLGEVTRMEPRGMPEEVCTVCKAKAYKDGWRPSQIRLPIQADLIKELEGQIIHIKEVRIPDELEIGELPSDIDKGIVITFNTLVSVGGSEASVTSVFIPSLMNDIDADKIFTKYVCARAMLSSSHKGNKVVWLNVGEDSS